METELDFNCHLILKIQRYWEEKGRRVELVLKDAGVDSRTIETNDLTGRVLSIRSNLRVGVPHG